MLPDSLSPLLRLGSYSLLGRKQNKDNEAVMCLCSQRRDVLTVGLQRISNRMKKEKE
jgi:hypothetical protein